MRMDLVVLGHVSIDHLRFPGKEEILLPGGAATAVATSAALAGAKVGLVTKVGEDFPGEWLEKLSSILDVRGVQVLPGRTIHIYMIYHEDGSVDAPVDMGVAQAMGETPIPEEYLKTKLFHIAPIPPGEQLKAIKRLEGKRISIDFNPTYMEDYKRKTKLMKEIVSRVEVIFPNEREALTITKAETAEEAAKILHDWGAKLVVITRSERGVLIYDGTFKEFPALPISPEEIVDPTGAGDAFAGGFLAGYSKGAPLEECVRTGLERAREILKKMGSWSIEV
ncbi:carbohydrate kinase family protein [Thermococcus sp. GR7]|uniref:carbohydrate kinase family protein n=1 Tax=unclassified Thermococcus TaxID=2627626 RepID=UPI00143105A7|nr:MULTISPECIES: carbohydrate kinase family protein [unclassified Thermococcus]NJE46093.1 carbohydrate kinase family protein [Thermococcus sp. GR7]NJE78271.1 carbohydrate kinase family protein [Thermococcus sp. GR4]NJF22290.1 carbohydrate kinase family protein [Thermococcus sp. GR5]